MRKEIGLPPTFTLDACRHGGLTELEEAELTDGQGKGSVAPTRPKQSYEGYAKRTATANAVCDQKSGTHIAWPRIPNRTLTY